MRHLVYQGVVAAVVLATSAAKAAPAHELDVDYRADGSVRVGSQVFATRAAFHRSSLFQESGARCGSVERQPDPEVMHLIAPSDCARNSTKINSDYDDDRTLVIPVVFHVIKRTDGTGDLSPALIESQVDILNEDFNALADTPGASGANARIQFVLARLDPTGEPTTGINYVTSNTYFSDPGSSGTNTMKRALKWDPKRFLNIYTNNAGGGGILGYATFPQYEAGGQEDGVVLNWRYVGRNAPGGEPYDQGRTGTHEVGHYLGLYHTFQSGCGSATAPYTSGDLIADTPREAKPNYGCTPVASGCSGGGMKPIENYMDYSEDTCMTRFTPEQVNRMRCSMINYRWVNTPPTADFTHTTDVLDATFTNTSTDTETPTELRYTWTFGDGETSTDEHPTHSYAAPGAYTVTLEVLDPGSGTSTTTQTVTVMAAPDAGGGVNDNDAGIDGGGTASGGCCDAQGSGSTALLLGMPLMLVVLRRRRARA
jgi:uncharacterized protein (TIGR03382 family)